MPPTKKFTGSLKISASTQNLAQSEIFSDTEKFGVKLFLKNVNFSFFIPSVKILMKIFSPLQVADIKSTLKADLHKLGLRVFMRPRNDVAEDTKNTSYFLPISDPVNKLPFSVVKQIISNVSDLIGLVKNHVNVV